MKSEYYIGLMSGTSIDSLDGILIAINEGQIEILSTITLPWEQSVQKILHQLCKAGTTNELEVSYAMANEIAKHEALAVNQLINQAHLKSTEITAIGSHGQTIRHCPEQGFSVQLDNGPLLCALTNIDTIFNFRMADLAAHGQGAPLTPIFHQLLLQQEDRTRFILNLGGIANLTILQGKELICGYDCGPANTLIDLACRELFNQPYDKSGTFAKQGKLNPKILDNLYTRFKTYIDKPYPKSTGRELFNNEAIEEELQLAKLGKINPYNLIHTLSEFTVIVACNEIRKYLKQHDSLPNKELILCGGGAHNPFLFNSFKQKLQTSNITVYASDKFNIDIDYFEAQAFAYFAYLFTHQQPLELHKITGSNNLNILGCLAPAANGFFARSKNNHKTIE